MEEKTVGMEQLNTVRYGSFQEIFQKMRALSERYDGLPAGSILNAFGTIFSSYGGMYTDNPQVQNRRVKGVNTRPADHSKNEIAQMLQTPEQSEQPLREVERALEYSAYPLKHLRMVYQNLLTYHSYVAPSLTDEKDAKDDAFWREWKLLEKLRKKLDPKDTCHMIAGQALQEGKVFYVPRVRADKSHNKVEYAFLQQLPSDYVKIVGFNSISKYTVAFNMMYFMTPGTTPLQFGDLFLPYIDDFSSAVGKSRPGIGTKAVYASIDMEKVREAADENVEAYYQNGKWCYWVTLPVDRVFPFEIDDTDRNVLPIFTGLFIDLIQLSQMEAIQLELLQNPLVSLLHGEIPYWDQKSDNAADDYKLSNAGRILFESLWYQMLTANNTGGIGLYMAPLENMKLESLAEAPNSMDIVSQGYQDLSAKAGISAIIPAASDTRAGAVQVSLMIESKLPQAVYRCYERMMTAVINNLNLTYTWDFRMFGDLSGDAELEKRLKEEMTLGILPSAIEYNAIRDRSILDDITWSRAVDESGVMELRKPLISSYNASNKNGNLPPHSEGGRPKSEGVTSDGQEGDLDSPGER